MNPRPTAVEGLAASVANLARRAAAEYAPIVDELVRTRSTDVRRIEHTLDGLLDFCFDPAMLLLYKELCRHYDLIDPAAAAEYVHAYRKMWDSDSDSEAPS